MDNLFDVKDKRIAITGGAGVLCGQMAKDLAGRGAKICILDFDLDKAKSLSKEIQDKGGFAEAVYVNVLEKDEVQKAFDETKKILGGVDVLINGAGGNRKQATTSDELEFFDLVPEAVRSVFDLNFLGTLLPSQVFAKEFAKAKKGTIINVSSMNAFCPLTKIPAYSAAKAAVSNFTQWLAVHLCQNYSTDIRVNAIAPGFFLTEQNRFLLTDENTGDLTSRGKTIVDHTPMGRFGSPEELTGAVVWLVSDASKFVTGTVVAIDGGFNAFSGV
jgi:NAD(P)-dependent dehydrogenase (short-subunit alcohol dehydrogenase family)